MRGRPEICERFGMPTTSLQFKCHSCNHCCTDVVCLPSPWDVKRIVKMIGAKPEEFLEFLSPEEIEGVEPDDPTWLDVDGERYLMALKRHEVKGCHFLNRKTRLCNIYEARPLLCRLYPFKVIETKAGKYKGFTIHDDVGCPRHKDGEVAIAPLRDLYCQDEVNQDDYRELVEIFNAKKYPYKSPDDFVTMFMHGLNQFDGWAGVTANGAK